MTSNGRLAAIGLCALTTAATAGCAASPRYPIQAGEAPGDGGLHMTQRPQYPIDAGGAPAGAPAYTPPPQAAPAPPPADEEDAPPVAPAASAPVESSDLPPPPPASGDNPHVAALDDLGPAGQGEAHWRTAAYSYAPAPALAAMIDDGAPVASPEGLELAAYRHRRPAETTAPDASTTSADTTKPAKGRASRRRTSKASTRIAAETDTGGSTSATPQTAASTTSRAGRRRHASTAAPADAGTMAQAEPAASPRRHGAKASSEAAATASTDQAEAAPTSRRGRRRHGAAETAAATPAAADQASPPVEETAVASSRRHGRHGKASDTQTAAVAETGAVTSTEAGGRRFAYQIQKGDTLYGIGRRFNLDAASIAKLNGLGRAGLQPGETVELPTGAHDVGSREHASGEATSFRPPPIHAPPTRLAAAPALRGRHGGADATEAAATADAATETGATTPQPSEGDRAATRRAEREARLKSERAKRDEADRIETARAAREVQLDTARAEKAARADLAKANLGDAAGLGPAVRQAPAEAGALASTRPPSLAPTPVPQRTAAAPPSTAASLTAAPSTSASSTAETSIPTTTPVVRTPAASVPVPGAYATSRPAATTYAAPSAGQSAAAIAGLAAAAGATSPPSAARTYGATPSAGSLAASTPRPAPTPTTSTATTSASAPSAYRATTTMGYPAAGYGTASRPATGRYAFGGSGTAARATTPTYAAASAYTPRPAYGSGAAYGSTAGYGSSSTYGAATNGAGYAAPARAYTPGQVATLNAPTYRGPTLGRVRPTAPVLSTGTLTNSDVAAAGQGRFVWPLHGAILQPFGDRGPGQRNDGMDIAAEPGESVRAAASGEVVYAGSSIPGFGNLILVKHPGGWVTAYAHLDRIEVRMRDAVRQGEEIGQAGQTGAVTQPQLHFEIRYAPDANEKARPVDPALVLPSAG